MQDWKKYTLEKLSELNLRAEKSEGQNFLIRYRIVKQIVEHAKIIPTDHVFEIGGGLGILTNALVETGAKVTVIEKDEKLAQFLTDKYANRDRVEVIEDDALLADWPNNTRIVANLPYSVSSPLLDRILHENIKDATIMVQKEFALRCIANPGHNQYSRLSILCQLHANTQRLMDIDPSAFVPQPVVQSVVLSIVKTELDTENDHQEIELLAKNLFYLKRRIVRKVIRGYLKRKDYNKEVWESCPYKKTRIFNLTAGMVDEILSHLKNHNAWPLAG